MAQPKRRCQWRRRCIQGSALIAKTSLAFFRLADEVVEWGDRKAIRQRSGAAYMTAVPPLRSRRDRVELSGLGPLPARRLSALGKFIAPGARCRIPLGSGSRHSAGPTVFVTKKRMGTPDLHKRHGSHGVMKL